jgi:hypothetical protein
VLGNPACDKEWYVGTMNRNDCEKMVMAAGKCDYLVRLASDAKNYAIVINQVSGRVQMRASSSAFRACVSE